MIESSTRIPVGFAETAGQLSAGAIAGYMYDGGIYGLPETQDFYVTFYRKDLLEALSFNTISSLFSFSVSLLKECKKYLKLSKRFVNHHILMYIPNLDTTMYQIADELGEVYELMTKLNCDMTRNEVLTSVNICIFFFILFYFKRKIVKS